MLSRLACLTLDEVLHVFGRLLIALRLLGIRACLFILILHVFFVVKLQLIIPLRCDY